MAINGKMLRYMSGPLVAESSSAASNSASTHTFAADRSLAPWAVELQRSTGELTTGADGIEVVLLVASAGDVVGEDPAVPGPGRTRRKSARPRALIAIARFPG